jgi:GalNAc-alpha-(1->4)-GalNAc-alpha-(1->3)-diNAcBac-PP-undecaprenol alpha-1,4-N-acetyl-D-galactosaminyltransferase
VSNKIKSIIFVISSLRGGGAERVLSILANYFVNNGYKIDIVYSMKCEQEPAYHIDEKVSLHRVPNTISTKKGGVIEGKKNTLLIFKHLRGKFKELKPEIIVSFATKINIYSIISKVGLDIPLIVSERISYDFLSSKSWKLLRRMTYPFSNGLVLQSKSDLGNYEYIDNKVVIYNPVNSVTADENIYFEKEHIILAAGRLNKQKGFNYLIDSIKNINIDNWKVFILGEGGEREYLEDKIKKYKLEKSVFLLGRRDDIFEYYKKASIFVLSSVYEGFPNVLAESMSFGCSPVAFDCKTGPSDLIENNINGFLVKTKNSAELGQKIELLMNDKTLRESLSRQAALSTLKLNIDNISQQWIDFIEHSTYKANDEHYK